MRWGWAQGLGRGRQTALLNNKSLAKYFSTFVSCYMYFIFLLHFCPSTRLDFFFPFTIHPQLLFSVLYTLFFSFFCCRLLSLKVLSGTISSSLKYHRFILILTLCHKHESISCIQSFDRRKKKDVVLFCRSQKKIQNQFSTLGY